MILRNETQGAYVIVSQYILRDQNLKLFDRGLLTTITGLPDNWSFSIKGLAKILPDGRDAIAAGIDRLIKLGYLVKEQLRAYGKFGPVALRICIPPITEKPLTENPATVKPVTDKPATDFTTQYNNKELNNKESNNKQIKKKGEKKDGNRKNNDGYTERKWTDEERRLYGL